MLTKSTENINQEKNRLDLAGISKHLLDTIYNLSMVESIDDLSYILHHEVHDLIPHEISVCGVGNIKSKRVYCLYNFGYPESFLKDITSTNGTEL